MNIFKIIKNIFKSKQKEESLVLKDDGTLLWHGLICKKINNIWHVDVSKISTDEANRILDKHCNDLTGTSLDSFIRKKLEKLLS